jgi:hypothetical protein
MFVCEKIYVTQITANTYVHQEERSALNIRKIPTNRNLT